jgi:hypothetical protein
MLSMDWFRLAGKLERMPVDPPRTRDLIVAGLYECIGLFSSIEDHAHSDRGTLADFAVRVCCSTNA